MEWRVRQEPLEGAARGWRCTSKMREIRLSLLSYVLDEISILSPFLTRWMIFFLSLCHSIVSPHLKMSIRGNLPIWDISEFLLLRSVSQPHRRNAMTGFGTISFRLWGIGRSIYIYILVLFEQIKQPHSVHSSEKKGAGLFFLWVKFSGYVTLLNSPERALWTLGWPRLRFYRGLG